MKAAIYNKETGEIVRRAHGDINLVVSCINMEEEFFLNCPDDATHIINNEAIKRVKDPLSIDVLMVSIRCRRGELLSCSDWTQVSDVPLTAEKKAEWVVYRQQLRDFPDVCDVNNPVWPTAPI